MGTLPSTHMSLLGRLGDVDDTAAWYDFFHRYGELIARVCRFFGLQRVDVDDVLQEVMIELTRSFERKGYDPARGRFRNYLKTIVRRAVFRRLRQNGRFKTQQSSWARSQPQSFDGEMSRVWELQWRQYHLRQAMGQIESEFSELNRLAFTFVAVNGKSAREAADALNISVEQVYQAKSRILRRLSELVAEQIQEEG